MKSIDFREKYFLILFPSQSRLAIWIKGIAVKVEIVGSSLMTYYIYIFLKIVSFFVINHDLHDFYKTFYV